MAGISNKHKYLNIALKAFNIGMRNLSPCSDASPLPCMLFQIETVENYIKSCSIPPFILYTKEDELEVALLVVESELWV